ncbi:MAG: hypothetical protein MJE66_22430 [Proteobacteria bacterium]|nr:hypothetical protein [Pseudomonadota bacterium]
MAFARRRADLGRPRGFLRWDPETQCVVASDPDLEALAEALAVCPDYDRHEIVLLESHPETGALFGAFLHRSVRGQPQGGVRLWHYDALDAYLRDGLRLARGMGRKCALAGLWWGGGKAVIARPPEALDSDAARRHVFAGFGRFVTSLRGAYVTAEDAGTRPLDMAEIYRHTRFATCVPTEVGGSGNPSFMTAAGVACAMEAGLDFLGEGGLTDKTVAMQGGGNVGGFLVGELLKRRVSRVVVAEVDSERCRLLADQFAGEPVDVRHVAPDDDGVLAEPCDVLAPNALGGVLGPKTIPSIQAALVCGAANNPLQDQERDAPALQERGVLLVPDYVANRMGIVSCANEQYGSIPGDPELARHLGRDWEGSVYQTTLRVLREAREAKLTPLEAANRLADRAALVPHPIWGHRTRDLVDGLLAAGWHEQQPER